MNQRLLLPDFVAAEGVLIGVACGILFVVYGISICYLRTMQSALLRCSPRNRAMDPVAVWLFLIPGFNVVWQFIIVSRVPDSLRSEFRHRDRDDGSDYGKSIGMAQAVLGVVNVPLSWAGFAFGQHLPELGPTFQNSSMTVSLIGFVLFIIFWAKIANYSKMLATDDGDFRHRERNFDDFDDDPRGGASPSPDAFKADNAGRYQR